jgi:hypothetical protein
MKVDEPKVDFFCSTMVTRVSMDANSIGKSLLFVPRLSRKFAFPPSIPKPDKHLPQLFKPCILPPWSSFVGGFATVNNGFATVTVVLSFYSLIILAESLKNHSKSQIINI